VLGVSRKGKPYVSYICGNEVVLSLKSPGCDLVLAYELSFYARDPIGETSVV